MKWILISGLGGDHRLFANIVDLLPDYEILDFAAPEPEETIERYAQRMYAQVDCAGSLVIGGTSFGGMLSSIACEKVQPKALVLMASTPRPVALKTSLRAFEWMSRAMPDAFAQWLRGLGRNAARYLEPLDPQQLQLIKDMATAAHLDLVRRGARMIMNWKTKPTITCPLFHIHGQKDLLIPVSQVQPTRILDDAGHLLNLTHPREIRDFVRHVRAQVE